MKAQPLRLRLREATGTAILEAAEQIAAAEGVSGASLQAIAKRAGIAVGTIYNYFDDKVELFDALFTRRREELFEAIDSGAKHHAGAPFGEQLEAFVSAVFGHFDARRDFLRIALGTEPPRPLALKGSDASRRSAMQQLHDRAQRVLRIGVREKCLRDDGADLLATVLVSMVRGVLIARSLDERPLASETARVVSLFLHGAAK